MKLIIFLVLGLVLATSSAELTRTPRWALDTTDDYVGTEFRFYSYNTQMCIRVDGSGAVRNGGTCGHAEEIFTFRLEDLKYWEDVLENWNTIKVIKFVHKDTGKCLSGTGSDTVALESCDGSSVNQAWRKVNSWQGARLYLVFNNVGRAKDLTEDSDDVYGGAPWLETVNYSNNNQWWQLTAA